VFILFRAYFVLVELFDRLFSTAPLLYNPPGSAYYRSLTSVALLSHRIRRRPLWSVQPACAVLTASIISGVLRVLVIKLSDVYVVFSAQLILVIFDLADYLSSEYSQLYRSGPLHYNKQYSI